MSDLRDKRHTLAHLLGAALLDLYPGARLATGPATETGFYYDADIPVTVSADALPAIEAKMREIAKGWSSFEKKIVTAEEASRYFADNPYKTEMIRRFSEEGRELTLYTFGSFTDLCAGGHADHFDEIALDGFALDSIAGAYWRGDSNNAMLTRIYGLAFDSAEGLAAHRRMLETAKERDHRVLGKDLGLFVFSPLVGPGLPLFTPKGTAVRKALEDALSILLDKYGYERVWIPHITKKDLYETSGHWEKFGEELFSVQGKHDTFALKPMNCPHHTQIYASALRSYQDLPIRYAEFTTVYRDEQKGELLGLTRVLGLTQDDGHIFCAEEQMEEEVSGTIDLIVEFYTALGFFGNDSREARLSVRGDDRKNYLGDPASWDTAESALQRALERKGIAFLTDPGEAAFYGPKIDFHFKDSLGRTWQLATIQVDFVMPDRFNLSYVDSDGRKKRPVMIHRAVSGSFERFLGILIEHFSGALPYFLAPVQARVLSVGKRESSYAEEVTRALKRAGVRADCDGSANTVGKKIAKAHAEKVPARIIVGKREMSGNTVTLEEGDEKVTLSVADCARRLAEKGAVFSP